MNTKHTPGPWSHGSAYLSKFAEIRDQHGDLIAQVVGSKFIPIDKTSANARLIAAAPDLLEALMNLTQWANVAGCGREEGSILDQNINAAIAAIAKATGTTNL